MRKSNTYQPPLIGAVTTGVVVVVLLTYAVDPLTVAVPVVEDVAGVDM